MNLERKVVGDSHPVKLIEPFRVRGVLQLLSCGVQRHVRHLSLSRALLIALETPAKVRFEVVPDDLHSELAAQLDEWLALLDGDVRVIDNDRASRPQGSFDQLRLPSVPILVVAEQILANVLVALGEPGVVERALPRSLQADEDDQLHGEERWL